MTAAPVVMAPVMAMPSPGPVVAMMAVMSSGVMTAHMMPPGVMMPAAVRAVMPAAMTAMAVMRRQREIWRKCADRERRRQAD